VDPTAGLDDMDKRKFLTLPGLELIPLGRPARSQSLYRLRYSGLGCYTTSWNVAGSIPDHVAEFFTLPNTSSRTMDPGFTQPLTEMSTRNLPGGERGKARLARKADKLTATFDPIV
jgi:hypothetical protein